MMRNYELTDANLMVMNIHETMSQARSVGLAEEAVRSELMPVINGFRANTNEVRRWWSTHDPLFETQHIVLEASVQLHNQDSSYLHGVQLDHAEDVITMAKSASCILSELVAGTDPLEMSYNYKLREPDNTKLDYNKVLDFLYAKLQEKDAYSIQELENLALAQELIEGATQYMAQGFREGWYVADGKTTEQTQHILETQAAISEYSADLLRVLTYAQEPQEPATSEEILNADHLRLIGLHASIHRSAYYESTSDAERYEGFEIDISDKDRKLQFGNLVADFQKLFDNPDSTMWQRLRQPHIKGSLHEALWFLDTTVLKLAYPNRYSHLAVWQASQSANHPTIGKPTWNRAYDYTIRKGDDMHFFQLKSSRQKGKFHEKVYHPAIISLEEDNFMELQPKRLRAKLHAYMQLLDEDFPPEKTEAVLDKYVMDTAWFAMDSCRADLQSRQAIIKKLLTDHYLPGFKQHMMNKPRNRAERRAAERANRKKKRLNP